MRTLPSEVSTICEEDIVTKSRDFFKNIKILCFKPVGRNRLEVRTKNIKLMLGPVSNSSRQLNRGTEDLFIPS